MEQHVTYDEETTGAERCYCFGVKLAAELTCDDWKTMEFAINILDIFEKATLQVSKSSSYISEVSF